MQETKENRAECVRLLKLCSNQAFFPTDKGIRKLLVDALMRSTKSQEHAERCIMRWIETDSLAIIEGQQRTVAPTVPDIIRLANSVNASSAPIPPCCHRCQSLGGRVAVTFTETKGVFAGELREGVRWCDCPRGLAMRAAEPKLTRAAPADRPEMQTMSEIAGKM